MIKSLLKSLLCKVGYRLVSTPSFFLRETNVELGIDETFILAHLLQYCPQPFVVQVGAFDGVENDFLNGVIRRYNLPGLLLEPQPAAFSKLEANYADQPQLKLCNAAVSDFDGLKRMYHLDLSSGELPIWAEQTATFCKETLLAHRQSIPHIEKLILSDNIKCFTFESLFSMHEIERVDILQIDAEGYDKQVLELFPFELYKPKMVRYEHNHLSTLDQEFCWNLLAKYGYSLFVPQRRLKRNTDTVAYALDESPYHDG